MKLARITLALFALTLAPLTFAQSFVVNSFIVGTADPAPTLTTATLTGPTTLVLAFSEPVSIGAGGNGGFAATLSGGAATLTYASGADTAELTYTVSRSVLYTETATLAYTQPGNGVEDSIGTDLASFSGTTITNSIPSEPSTTTSSIPHDELIEGFQNPTTGYEQTFSESGVTSALTKPYDSSALTTNKPADANNRALRFIMASGDGDTYFAWTRGSNINRSTTACDLIFYVYFDTIGSSASWGLARVTNLAGTVAAGITATKSGGVLTLTATGSVSSSAATVSESGWVKVHLHLDTTAANCYLQINDGGTSNTFTRSAVDYGEFRLGATNAKSAGDTGTLYFDLICINTP